jgi:hypothetical protein
MNRRLRQVDLARIARVPRGIVMSIEAGDLENVTIGQTRRVAQALGGRLDARLMWRGDGLDRLMNQGHARMHEATIRWLRSIGGWVALPEISFSRDGERGVIDIVAWHAATRSLLIIELKTRLVDLSDLMSSMDIRRRIAPRIAADQGWDPAHVSVWVLVAPGRTNKRILSEHRAVLRAKFPDDGRSMRRWLARPEGSIAALSFLPQVPGGDLGHGPATPRRVRLPNGHLVERGVARRKTFEPRIGVTFGA